MRPFLAPLALLVSSAAFAVPMEFAHQGRLLDASGAPLTGDQVLSFRIYGAPSGGSALWAEESVTVAFDAGYFSTTLGDDTALDSALFDGSALWLALQVGSGAELPTRVQLVAVPYAVRAGIAGGLDAGVAIDVASLDLDGTPVLGADGTLDVTAVQIGGATVLREDGTIDASAIGSGTIDASRLPVGTSAGTVAAGDHGHSAADVGALPEGTTAADIGALPVGTTAADIGAVPAAGATASCGSATTGSVRWTGAALQFCDGTDWREVALRSRNDGSSKDVAALSCAALLADDPSTKDGTYWIDPDGGSTSNAFQAACDMTTDGGGWTLVLHLDAPTTQLTGSGRDRFWQDGATLSSWSGGAFSSMKSSDRGFVGWDRLAPLLGGDVDLLATGTNELGEAVSESYRLKGFEPNSGNGKTERGSIDGGGLWTLGVQGDSDHPNGWGTCGTTNSGGSHVGLGLCVTGLNGDVPKGRELQVWHYGNWTQSFNLSFGEPSTGDNYTYPTARGASADLRLWLRE